MSKKREIDKKFAQMVWVGWAGTRVENWITRQFYAIVSKEYPTGEFPL